jgi:hypothetical protein
VTSPLTAYTALVLSATCLACAAIGCSPAPIDLGKDPDFIFFTDHESGDLSSWSMQGQSWVNAGGTLDIVGVPARSGRHAVRSRIVAQPVGTQSAALLFASNLPDDAYFSAWFYLPEAVSPSYYWTLFKIASQPEPISDMSTEIWVLDLDPDPNGGTLRLFSEQYPEQMLDYPPRLPVGRWFQIEAYVSAPTPDDGELHVWVDGTSVLERHGPTLPTPYVSFVIGSGAEGLESEAAALYLDDAAVTRRRLGPDFPAFWRAE